MPWRSSMHSSPTMRPSSGLRRRSRACTSGVADEQGNLVVGVLSDVSTGTNVGAAGSRSNCAPCSITGETFEETRLRLFKRVDGGAQAENLNALALNLLVPAVGELLGKPVGPPGHEPPSSRRKRCSDFVHATSRLCRSENSRYGPGGGGDARPVGGDPLFHQGGSAQPARRRAAGSSATSASALCRSPCSCRCSSAWSCRCKLPAPNWPGSRRSGGDRRDRRAVHGCRELGPMMTSHAGRGPGRLGDRCRGRRHESLRRDRCLAHPGDSNPVRYLGRAAPDRLRFCRTRRWWSSAI